MKITIDWSELKHGTIIMGLIGLVFFVGVLFVSPYTILESVAFTALWLLTMITLWGIVSFLAATIHIALAGLCAAKTDRARRAANPTVAASKNRLKATK